MSRPTVIVITGPTASGKSALAVSLAEKLDTEIINADSRQIYQGIPIVTAAPSKEEKKGVMHHLLEFLPLEGYYSAACFQEDATLLLNKIFENKETAIVCGGSMLYIDALVHGIDELPTVPQNIREPLAEEWKRNGNEWLLEKLRELDRDYFDKTDLRNLKRVFHAVEISLTAGVPYSSLLTGRSLGNILPFDIIKICLTGSRESLFNRINQRVLDMMEKGLMEEARNVYHLRHLNSLNTVGLKEMFTYFDGNFTLDEAISRIQKNTRVYAKKQLTWHRRDENIRYLDFENSSDYNIDKIIRMISQKS